MVEGEVTGEKESKSVAGKRFEFVEEDSELFVAGVSKPPVSGEVSAKDNESGVVDLGNTGTVGNPEEGLLEQTQPGVNELVPGLAHKVFADMPLKNMDPGMSEDKDVHVDREGDALGEVEVPSEAKSKGNVTSSRRSEAKLYEGVGNTSSPSLKIDGEDGSHTPSDSITKGNTEMTNDVENVAIEMYGTSGGEVSDSGGDTGEGVEIDKKGQVAGNVETASQLLGIDQVSFSDNVVCGLLYKGNLDKVGPVDRSNGLDDIKGFQGREKESSLNCDHNVFDKKPEPSPIAKFVAVAGQVKPGQEPDGNISKEASLLVQSGSEDEEDVDGDEEEDGLRDKTVSGSDSGYEATGAHSLTNLNQVFLSVSNVVSLPNEAHGVNLLAESCLLEVLANEESRTGAQCRDASGAQKVLDKMPKQDPHKYASAAVSRVGRKDQNVKGGGFNQPCAQSEGAAHAPADFVALPKPI
ncbi:hypothetical protein U1Q18_045188, partial [Sarracenia purpurea var. burkii]